LSERAPENDHLFLKIAGAVLVALLLAGAVFWLARTFGPRPKSSLAAYQGLGTWVDIYDTKAWANPQAAVKDMAGHGVRTVFLETGNSKSKTAIFKPQAQEAFIKAAHAKGMKVVAWYLPDMIDTSSDLDRISQAIKFKTSDGQSFDSFALDIESTAIGDETSRNKTLEVLSSQIRRLVGRSYPLGAIIPSPVGISKQADFWNAFPYTSLAKTYDVFVPMGYYTYHGKGAAAATADALGNVRIIRSQPGCANIPIHLIGGIAEKSTAAEVKAFANATVSSGCIGASLYGWAGTTAADWKALAVVNR
jgi:hypothetical protein